MSSNSDFWKPLPYLPYRILRGEELETPTESETDAQGWQQWGGSYPSLHCAAGYLRAHRPDLERKRIVLVEERHPDHRPGIPNYRLVTLWQGEEVPDYLGHAPESHSTDHIHITD